MPKYLVKGSKDGQPVEQWLHAPALVEARRIARMRGIKVQSIEQGEDPSGRVIRQEDFLEWLGMYADAINMGVQIPEALRITADAFKHSTGLNRLILTMEQDIAGGLVPSACFEKYPDYFDAKFVAMIRAAESSGRVGDTLKDLYRQAVSAEKQRQEFVKGMVYPSALIIATLLSAVYFGQYVSPQIFRFFAGKLDRMPDFSRWILSLTINIRNLSPILLPAVGLFFYQAFRNENFQKKLGQWVGSWISRIRKFRALSQQSELFKMMSMSLKAGVSMMETLNLLYDIAREGYYGKAIQEIQRSIEKGHEIHSAFENAMPDLDPLIYAAMRTGQSIGNMDEQLARISSVMEERVQKESKALLDWAVHATMAIAFAVSGSLIVGVYLALGSTSKLTG